MLKDLKLGVLLKNLDKSNFSFNLDLVLEGGCMNGAYEIGGLILIKELEKLKYFKIKRVSGASVGAYAGLLYLIDKLHVYVEEYEIMKEGFRETLTLEKLEQQLRKLVYNLPDKEFKSLQKNKLYVRFYDINTQECILKHKYKTREELIETILKSCHMPFLINGKMFYEKDKKQYIDGGMPYIFNDLEMKQNRKTLYMTLTRYDKIKSILNVSNEKTIHGRVLEGIIDTYNFFLKNRMTDMCSYVEEWGISETLRYSIFSYAYKLLVYMIYILYKIHEYIYPYISETPLYKNFTPLMKRIYKNTVIYLVFN
jgi:hypothetical protein